MRVGRRAIQVLDLLALGLLFHTSQARLQNISIDDTYGDLTTGQKPIYQPSAAWYPEFCGNNYCSVFHDPSDNLAPFDNLAFDNTWTATMYNPSLIPANNNISITLSFTGISVWIFFILASGGLGTPAANFSNTQCNFTIDGDYMASFSHLRDYNGTASLQYNATVFSASGLSNTQHELVISSINQTLPGYINFDYAIYTAVIPDNTTTSSSAMGSATTGGAIETTSALGPADPHHFSSSKRKLKIIVGFVVGGLALVLLTGGVILFRCLGKKWNAGSGIRPFAAAPLNQRSLPGKYNNVAAGDAPLPWQNPIYPRRKICSTSQDIANAPASLVPVRGGGELSYEPIIKNRDELRTVRQTEIDQRPRTAEQGMANLAPIQTTMSNNRPGRQEVENEMEALREQMDQLRAQIEQLQPEQPGFA